MILVWSDRRSWLAEGSREPPRHELLDAELVELVVSAADVLDECVPGDDNRGCALGLEHRSRALLQLPMIGLDPVVGVGLAVVPTWG